jgi:hypothetical protein
MVVVGLGMKLETGKAPKSSYFLLFFLSKDWRCEKFISFYNFIFSFELELYGSFMVLDGVRLKNLEKVGVIEGLPCIHKYNNQKYISSYNRFWCVGSVFAIRPLYRPADLPCPPSETSIQHTFHPLYTQNVHPEIL